jgi:hypothetical protein
MAKKHSKKSNPLKLIILLLLIAAIFITVFMSQRQQNVKQEASLSGVSGSYCTSDKDCSTGLACTNYKCGSSDSFIPTGKFEKDGDYSCTRCSASNKFCVAAWHEGDTKCDRNNVISDTIYNVDCNCKTGVDKGACPDGKSTSECQR